MPSVKKNIVLNGLNTVTAIIFPVITFPYAARVLLPEGIGAVNFLNSIIKYIILLTSIGIPLYAVKEVAKWRDDREKRNAMTVEVIMLSSFLCLLGYIAVWLLAKYVPRIHEQEALFYILSLSIIFNSIGVEWFYKGMEQFKYITIRGIIFRTVSALALFIFVKNPNDLLIYGMIIVGSTVGSNLFNFIHLRKFIKIPDIKFKQLRIFKHLKPALHVFVLNVIISLYALLNSIMLGFLSGDTQVGYFTAGSKISHIGLTFISSISTVLLPRSSNLLQKGDYKQFTSLINKSLNLILALSLPMSVGLIVLAVPVTLIFCGNEYLDSIPVLYLNAPVIIIIALTNLMGIQVLYPKDKINIVIISVVVAAVLNCILNFVLIPTYGAIGAAVSTLIAEISVLVVQIIAGRKYFPFKISYLIQYKVFLAALIMGVAVYFSSMVLRSESLKLIVGVIIGISVYSVCLYLMSVDIMRELLTTVAGKFHASLDKKI